LTVILPPHPLGFLDILIIGYVCFCLYPKFMIAERGLTERIIILLEIIYGSFVVWATLCLIRLTSLLPQILSNKNPMFDPSINLNIHNDFPNPENVAEMKLYAFFSEYFFVSFPTFCVLAFVLSRFVLNYLDCYPVIAQAVARAKKVWTNTLVCWAAIFTVISTISLLISASS
jgi:hypothetical protein